MSSKNSADFVIRKAHAIPYGGGQEMNLSKYFRNSARGEKMNPFRFALKRIKSYICCVLAYVAPSNKIRVALNRLKGVNIANGSYIGMFVFIDNAHPEYVYIEEDVAINAGCMLVAHFNPMGHYRRTIISKVDPIIIKKGAMLGMRSIINPGVIVGDYSMVSSGSVVYRNVEPQTIVRGNPAEVIGKVRL